MPSLLEIASSFARCLDHDDFDGARVFLADECTYELRGSSLHGPLAILASYEDASRIARATFQSIRYESEVVAVPNGVRVFYTDILTHKDRSHEHRSSQLLSANHHGLIDRIVHEEIPGQKEALKDYMRIVGVAGLAK